MVEDLRKLVELTIDSTIREFDPEDRKSYERCDLSLKLAEEALRKADLEVDCSLLASVCAERIRIAYEVAKLDLAIELTALFLAEFPSGNPSYSWVASLRSSALHSIGAHEQEIGEALQLARNPDLRGSEYIYLLAILSKRHPGCIPTDQDLWQKLQHSIEELRSLGYETLPTTENGSMQLEELARQTANELRQANLAQGEALLKEPL